MKKYSRYRFVDYTGNQCGIENVEDLQEAIQTAIDYQCEVIDIQTSEGNQIVFSVWDGWNCDYEFYNKDMNQIIK